MARSTGGGSWSPFGPVWWKPVPVVVKGAGPLEIPTTPIEIQRRLLRIRITGLPVAEVDEFVFIQAAVYTATGEARELYPLTDSFLVPVGVPLAVHLRGFSRHFWIFPLAPFSGDGEGVVTRTVRLDPALLSEKDSPPPVERPEEDVKVVLRDDTGRLISGVQVRILEEETLDENGEVTFYGSPPARTIRVSAPGLWDHVEAVEGAGPFVVVLPSSAVSLKLPSGVGATARLHGRRFGKHPNGGGLWIRGVPPGSHRVVLVLDDGRRFQQTVTIGETEDLVLEAPPAK